MPAKPKFTRIPKVRDLMKSGVPAEVIPTYCALTDYANNKTGLCWPKMETLAELPSVAPSEQSSATSTNSRNWAWWSSSSADVGVAAIQATPTGCFT